MSAITLEGTIENGAIRLLSPVKLPEKSRVYVVIPEIQAVASEKIIAPRQTVHIYSPRLRNRSQISAFDLVEVVGDSVNEL